MSAGPFRFSGPRVKATAVILLLLLTSLALFASPVVAAGDEIRVLSGGSEVRFPGNVVFNLEAEGDAGIVEVKLYYRVTPSGIWTYAYLDLAPSPHVETSFGLRLSGNNYLPPGTELEYYYSIRDAQGHTLRTRPETFVYIDDRFNWETTVAGPLTIYWHDLSEKRVREVAQEVDKSLVEVSDRLGVPLDKPMRGVIYNSRAEAREAFPYQSETITEKQIFQGFAFPGRGVFVGVGLHPRLIVHEAAHLLLDEATPSPTAKVPAWVNEGFASYVEPGAHGYRRGSVPASPSSGLMPLRHMYSVPGAPEDIRYFYRKSENVVAYLLETYGPEKFRTFLGRLDKGKDAGDALNVAYGFDLQELDERWLSTHVQQDDGDTGGGAFPFSYAGTLVIAALVLVVMGIVIVNFIARGLKKKREGLEEGDRLTEEEWEGRP